jgi:hypothetical protein
MANTIPASRKKLKITAPNIVHGTVSYDAVSPYEAATRSVRSAFSAPEKCKKTEDEQKGKSQETHPTEIKIIISDYPNQLQHHRQFDRRNDRAKRTRHTRQEQHS